MNVAPAARRSYTFSVSMAGTLQSLSEWEIPVFRCLKPELCTEYMSAKLRWTLVLFQWKGRT
jgi:hypothetical protein